jgi:hypothetical protein
MMTLEEMEKQLKATQNALSELGKRVRVTEDIQEIHQLQRRYIDAVICTEWDAAIECFAEDGKIDVYLHEPAIGKASITKFYKEELPKTHAGKEGDILVHPVISVDGDKARGSWLLYMMYAYPRTGQSLFWVQGYYDMEYVRENGRWKISCMRWSERMGLPGGGPPAGLW